MSTVHGPPVPAGPAEDLPPAPWTGPSGPAGPGGPGSDARAGKEAGGPVRRPRRRGLVITADAVTLALAAAVGTAWGLHATSPGS